MTPPQEADPGSGRTSRHRPPGAWSAERRFGRLWKRHPGFQACSGSSSTLAACGRERHGQPGRFRQVSCEILNNKKWRQASDDRPGRGQKSIHRIWITIRYFDMILYMYSYFSISMNVLLFIVLYIINRLPGWFWTLILSDLSLSQSQKYHTEIWVNMSIWWFIVHQIRVDYLRTLLKTISVLNIKSIFQQIWTMGPCPTQPGSASTRLHLKTQQAWVAAIQNSTFVEYSILDISIHWYKFWLRLVILQTTRTQVVRSRSQTASAQREWPKIWAVRRMMR